jgi:nucleoside-diphosphate-sugar epimerase
MSDRDRNTGPVVVTGANGFVGSRVSRRLSDNGRRVRALVRTPGFPDLQRPGIEEIVGDFTNPEVARAATLGADAVVHCAAGIGPEVETARHVNVDGTRAMVEAALEERVRRYVQISTISVYAKSPAERVDEEASIKSEGDPYGLTKADADRVVLEAMMRGLPAVILRPGAILGVHPTSTWGVKAPARIRDRVMKLRGDGREPMPWVHVENLVDAVLLALDDDRAVGRVYNVADETHSWREFTDEIRAWFGTEPLDAIPESEVAAQGGYSVTRYDAARLRGELGYKPRRTYREGMDEAAGHWAREGAAHGS